MLGHGSILADDFSAGVCYTPTSRQSSLFEICFSSLVSLPESPGVRSIFKIRSDAYESMKKM